MTNSRLQVRRLGCVREQRCIFTDISFELGAGELLFVQGANGAGKSSLLRILAGLATPHQGNIVWQQQTIHHPQSDYRNRIHYLGHSNGLKTGLTVLENLQLAQHLFAMPPRCKPREILDKLQLGRSENCLIRQLSAGQQRRVALARILLFEKTIWFLDEPFTALDAVTQAFFASQLQAHLQNGGMVVMSSHQQLPLKQGVIKYLGLTSC